MESLKYTLLFWHFLENLNFQLKKYFTVIDGYFLKMTT